MRAAPQVTVLWWGLRLGGLAYVLALVGLAGTGEYAVTPADVTALIFQSAGVLAFEEPDAAALAGWPYWLARLFALGFALLAATGVVLEVFRPVREQLLRARFELDRAFNPATLVVGLGWIGGPLVSTLRTWRRPVIAVSLDDDGPQVEQARREGTLVLVGDVTDPAMQQRVPFQAASEVFVATGDDARNIEVAGALLLASRSWRRPRRRGPLRCYVHLESARRELALARRGLWSNHGDALELHAFSQPELAARDLFFHPGRGIVADPAALPVPGTLEPFHLFVFGFGPTGQAVARHLSRFGHFGSLIRPRLTVFARDAAGVFGTFLQHHPAFSPPDLDLLDPAFQEGHADDWDQRHGRPVVERYRSLDDDAVEYVVNAEAIELSDVQSDATTGAVLKRLRPSAGRTVRAAIVVCFEDDRVSFEAALNLQHALFNCAEVGDGPDLPVPIHVYLPVEHGLATVVDSAGAADVPEQRFALHPFGRRDEVASHERITRPDLAVHARGARRVYERLEPDRRAQRHPDFLASNLDSVQHVVVKLAALGIRLVQSTEPAPAGATRVLPELLSTGVDAEVSRLRPETLDDEHFSALSGPVRQRLALLDAAPGVGGIAVQAAIDAAVDAFEADLRAAGRDPGLVARMEHHRWMGERLTAGWRYGERSDTLRTRPSMVPFDRLDRREQRHDQVDLVRYLAQEWTWGRTPWFGPDPSGE